MRIAISSQGKDLEAEVDLRFGRAAYFLIVDSETLSFDVVENSQSLSLPQGAGVQAAQNVLQHKPDIIITGNCGPKAFRILEAAGIGVVIGAGGSVMDAVKAYKDGKLQPSEKANVEGHWG